jgi:hypothetical protein
MREEEKRQVREAIRSVTRTGKIDLSDLLNGSIKVRCDQNKYVSIEDTKKPFLEIDGSKVIYPVQTPENKKYKD